MGSIIGQKKENVAKISPTGKMGGGGGGDNSLRILKHKL